jgi:hypothetical protein
VFALPTRRPPNCRELLQVPISGAISASYAIETKARAEVGTEFAFELRIAGMLLW